MTSWLIEDLPPGRLDEAWPLIWLRDSTLTLDRWLVEARSLLAEAPTAGVQVAQTPSGYIYAVCAWRIDRTADDASEMTLPFVAYVQWNGAADPLANLIDATEDIARRKSCTHIRLGGRPIAAIGDTLRWERLGYRWAGDALEKHLIPPRAPQDTQGVVRLHR